MAFCTTILNQICCCLVSDLPKTTKHLLRSLLIFICFIKEDEDVMCSWGVRDNDYPVKTDYCTLHNSVQYQCANLWTCSNIHCCDYTCYSFKEENYCQCILGVILTILTFIIRWILSFILAILMLPLAILLLIFGIAILIVVIFLFIPFICCMLFATFVCMLVETS
jgi:hypothetical protein